MRRTGLRHGVGAMMLVLILSGCSTSKPVSVSGLERVFGTALPGAQGKTLEDQRKIDLTVAGGCSARLYSKEQCNKHTERSVERRKELINGG